MLSYSSNIPKKLSIFFFLKVQSVKFCCICFIQFCRIAIATGRARSFGQFSLNFLCHVSWKNCIIKSTIVLIAGYFSTLWNSTDISKFCRKGQILWLGSKFRSSRKTVGLSYKLEQIHWDTINEHYIQSHWLINRLSVHILNFGEICGHISEASNAFWRM